MQAIPTTAPTATTILKSSFDTHIDATLLMSFKTGEMILRSL